MRRETFFENLPAERRDLLKNGQWMVVACFAAGLLLWAVDAPGDIFMIFAGGLVLIGAAVSSVMLRQKRMQDCMEQAKHDWEDTFDIINDAITIHDKNFNIIRANKAATEMLSAPFSVILERKCYMSYHGTDYPPESCPSCRTLATGIPSITETFEPNLKKYLEIKALPRFNRDRQIIGVVHVVRDISARIEAEEELRALSLTDDLTGLCNRRGFMTLAEQQQKLAIRMNRGYYMLFVDLDGLKMINDTFGHSEGCHALIETSLILRQCFRESDIISRIGGDEFVVFSIENRTVGCADVITDRLQKKIDEYNAGNSSCFRLSMSMGIVYCGPEGRRPISDILHEADQLMYAQKKSRQDSKRGTVA